MRFLKFYEPNFRCTVVDPGGNQDIRLEHAASADELRQRLEQARYTVTNITPYKFTEWKTKAQKATTKVLDARRKKKDFEFASDVWGELKQYLFSLSNGMCAYCEGRVLPVASGDVEHFRPKKKVEEDVRHTGYYWLAYDIRNLLPCCERCNRARAKMNHFPLGRNGRRAKGPRSNLKSERPLLLNPFVEDPKRHLKFVIVGPQKKLGTVAGLTDVGKTSVKVYNLNRGDLVQARSEAIENFRLSLGVSVFNPGFMDKTIADLGSGRRDYSTALTLAFQEWWNEQKASVEAKLKSVMNARP